MLRFVAAVVLMLGSAGAEALSCGSSVRLADMEANGLPNDGVTTVFHGRVTHLIRPDEAEVKVFEVFVGGPGNRQIVNRNGFDPLRVGMEAVFFAYGNRFLDGCDTLPADAKTLERLRKLARARKESPIGPPPSQCASMQSTLAGLLEERDKLDLLQPQPSTQPPPVKLAERISRNRDQQASLRARLEALRC